MANSGGNLNDPGESHQRRLMDQEASSDEEGLPIGSNLPMEGKRAYWKSYAAVELGLSFCFLVAAIYLESSNLIPHQRPIPYQQSEASGEYLLNQVFNEEFLGETVSGACVCAFLVCERFVPGKVPKCLGWTISQNLLFLSFFVCLLLCFFGGSSLAGGQLILFGMILPFSVQM